MADIPDSGRTAEPAPAPAQELAMTRIEPGDDRDHHERRERRPFTDGATAVRRSATAARRRAFGIVATSVSAVTTVVVVIMAVHILFVAFEANTANGIVRWFGDRATELCWQFEDVFQPENPKTEVAVNYGLAAAVYLIAGRLLTTLIRRRA
ncbi:hypothetical protein E1264_27520 [Actinomadura sp. KC216]|uniref:hypothetical protein n=1 Tax=Actinomadura sp. KC216 TaxID=2530370 RepID=UPI001043A786|nr:hypothetical protein [Actinomadura sp. KC216]TDB83668.1 hypothetical protein E1264_27520 [Actinomadura sp. KC216]